MDEHGDVTLCSIKISSTMRVRVILAGQSELSHSIRPEATFLRHPLVHQRCDLWSPVLLRVLVAKEAVRHMSAARSQRQRVVLHTDESQRPDLSPSSFSNTTILSQTTGRAFFHRKSAGLETTL